MNIDLSPQVIEQLRDILDILSRAADAHTREGTIELPDDEALIEPWTPSDWEIRGNDGADPIICDYLTVGTLRKAKEIKQKLKL